jgi:hypothetical protein
MSYDLFPDDYVCRFRGFTENQRGFFLSKSLNTLIVGKIKQHRLVGRVFHSGLTQKDIDKGRYFAAFNEGYSYGNWDKHDFVYVGKIRDFVTLDGFLSFIQKADFEAFQMYYKTKELLQDKNSIK